MRHVAQMSQSWLHLRTNGTNGWAWSHKGACKKVKATRMTRKMWRCYFAQMNESCRTDSWVTSYKGADNGVRATDQCLWLFHQPIHMCDMTHPYVRQDAFICATWLMHMCDTTSLIVSCQNIVSFVGLFCKRDLLFYRSYYPKPSHIDTSLIMSCDLIMSKIW